MAYDQERLIKLREERVAKEKARIIKLRKLNLKKYGKIDILQPKSVSTVSLPVRSKSDLNIIIKSTTNSIDNLKVNNAKGPSISPPASKKIPPKVNNNPKNDPGNLKKSPNKVNNVNNNLKKTPNKVNNVNNAKKDKPVVSKIDNKSPKVVKNDQNNVKKDKPLKEITSEVNIKHINRDLIDNPKTTITEAAKDVNKGVNNKVVFKPYLKSRKSISVMPKIENKPKTYSRKSIQPNQKTAYKESVFDRLYKPKIFVKKCVEKVLKLKTDPCYLWQVINESQLIMNTIHSVFVPFNFSTLKLEDLQARLQSWLKKRGKSIDSYHHLQCFGLHNIAIDIRPLNLDTPKYDAFDDENKENIALEHDSDNDSYLEIKNQQIAKASSICDSVDYNESYETTLTSGEGMHHVDELLLGALNDLTELLSEGFDWEQCARWLCAIHDRFPSAPDSASYWECRAALEERCGNLLASVHCWEQAIAKGTKEFNIL